MVLSDITNLGRYSKSLIVVKCDKCLCEKEIKYKLYTEYGYSNGEYFCRKCKLVINNQLKYGVDNVFQLNDIKEKIKKTNLDKYGYEYITQSKEIQNKIKETNIEKYGVEHHMKNVEIFNKVKNTNLDKYGVDNVSKTDFVKDKKVKTCNDNFGVDYIFNNDNFKLYSIDNNLKNYGFEYFFNSIEFKNKSKLTNNYKYGYDSSSSNLLIQNKIRDSNINTSNNRIISNNESIQYIDNFNKIFTIFCNKCDSKFQISYDLFYKRKEYKIPLCTVCYPVGDQKSIKEKNIYEYIKSIYPGEIIQSYRDKLEIDIYLPELKIGFEFNGLYWHSEKFKEKNYHLDKTNYFKERGIRIIHIWEDDWTFKQDIVKSQINNLLNLNTKKIFARKCVVKNVDIKESRKFLDDNHIQGFTSSNIKIGLYYDKELVSIMTFDQSEGRKKMEEGGYNLSRFCNKIGYNVVGGASKLLSNFIKTYKPTRIISYADKDWSVGKLYYTLGFDNISDSKPDYKYIVSDKRVHKSRYKKVKLKIENMSITETQAMKNKNILRVYDCGKIKFELNL